jgi:hypothetical protein
LSASSLFAILIVTMRWALLGMKVTKLKGCSACCTSVLLSARPRSPTSSIHPLGRWFSYCLPIAIIRQFGSGGAPCFIDERMRPACHASFQLRQFQACTSAGQSSPSSHAGHRSQGISEVKLPKRKTHAESLQNGQSLSRSPPLVRARPPKRRLSGSFRVGLHVGKTGQTCGFVRDFRLNWRRRRDSNPR